MGTPSLFVQTSSGDTQGLPKVQYFSSNFLYFHQNHVFSFQFPRFLSDTNTLPLNPSKKTVCVFYGVARSVLWLRPLTSLPARTISSFDMSFGNICRTQATAANLKAALSRIGAGVPGFWGCRQRGKNIANAFVLFRLRSHDASILVKRLNIKVGLLCRRSRTACERPRHEVH